VADTLGFSVKEVIINDLVEGIFHAKLVVEQNGMEVEIDARSSDAIALALRFDCPVFTYEFILSAAGLKVEEGDEEKGDEDKGDERREKRPTSLEDLQEQLNEALQDEDYERASKIRDEIKRREGSN
jgi:bifunctional DNase/RNase